MTASAPEHFNAIAGQYAASEVHASSPTIRRLHELLDPRQPDSICEVACGPGYLALSFAGKAGRIVGVDAAPNMLRQFEKLASEQGVKVETVLANAEAMPLPSDSFDAVVSRLAPHHFTDAAKAVQEMARLAKPGRSVAVIDLEGNENPAFDELNHKIEVLHDPSHVRSYTAARWREFFEMNGLTIETLESGQTELPGGLAIRRWCEIGSTPKAAEAKIRARLTAAPGECLAALGIRFANGEFHIPVRTLIVVGRKNPAA
ncbi:MAG TPA: class I SAM-dependent methyltransferase [Candidatus Saccharimonadales bacterium]|nr:class I SAM-dependent methyltransferase [Candidatus Saccharimonadales bacterium]